MCSSDLPACRTSWVMEYGNAGFASSDGKRSWGADRRPGQDTPTAEWRQQDPGSMPPGDVYGGGAPTGISFYENGALPKKYRGLLLSCESAKNVVFGYFPKLKGAGFEMERFDFLTSNPDRKWAGADFKGRSNQDLNTWFRPADVCVGPDGAIYVADWFDPRVGGHGTQDRTLSGTIYRIAPNHTTDAWRDDLLAQIADLAQRADRVEDARASDAESHKTAFDRMRQDYEQQPAEPRQPPHGLRSEERPVGKECRSRWSRAQSKNK